MRLMLVVKMRVSLGEEAHDSDAVRDHCGDAVLSRSLRRDSKL